MVKCIQCDDDVLAMQESIKCKNCKIVGHTDCLLEIFNTQDKRKLKNWMCSECKNKKDNPETSGEDTGDEVKDPNRYLMAQLAAMNKKLEKLDEISEVRKSVQFMSTQYDQILKENQEQKKLIEQLARDMTDLKISSSNKDEVISDLSNRVNELEQANLSMHIEIHNVEKLEGEKLESIIDIIAQKIDAPSVKDSICDVYRKPVNMNNSRTANLPPIIVVKFKSTEARGVWLNKIKSDKITSGMINNNDKVFQVKCFEMLTPYYKNLLWKTRTAALDLGYKYIWAKNGKIFIKRAENVGTVRIQSENDVFTKIIKKPV
jgi:Baculovirus FP protein